MGKRVGRGEVTDGSDDVNQKTNEEKNIPGGNLLITEKKFIHIVKQRALIFPEFRFFFFFDLRMNF